MFVYARLWNYWTHLNKTFLLKLLYIKNKNGDISCGSLTPNINNLSLTSIFDWCIYPTSRLNRYMEQSKIDVGNRLLILGVKEQLNYV